MPVSTPAAPVPTPVPTSVAPPPGPTPEAVVTPEAPDRGVNVTTVSSDVALHHSRNMTAGEGQEVAQKSDHDDHDDAPTPGEDSASAMQNSTETSPQTIQEWFQQQGTTYIAMGVLWILAAVVLLTCYCSGAFAAPDPEEQAKREAEMEAYYSKVNQKYAAGTERGVVVAALF